MWNEKIKGDHIRTTIEQAIHTIRKGNFGSIKEEDELNSSVDESVQPKELDAFINRMAKGSSNMELDIDTLPKESKETGKRKSEPANPMLIKKKAKDLDEVKREYVFEPEHNMRHKTPNRVRAITLDECLDFEPNGRLHKSNMDINPDNVKPPFNRDSSESSSSEEIRPESDSKDIRKASNDLFAKKDGTKTSQKSSKERLKALTAFELMRPTINILDTSGDRIQQNHRQTKTSMFSGQKADNFQIKTAGKSPFPHKSRTNIKTPLFSSLKRPTHIPERKEKKVSINRSLQMKFDGLEPRKMSAPKKSDTDKVNFLDL